MNIVYVCADRGIPVLGNKGASVHVRSLTAAMQRLGHRVTLVARRWDEGNAVPRVHRREQLARATDEAANQLERIIREERADFVIERYSLQSGAARIATRRCIVRLMLEVNAPLVEEATRYRGLDDPAAAQREHETLRTADRIQVVSSALLRYVSSVAPDVPAVWIPNGAPVSTIRAAAAAGVADLGALGRLHGLERLERRTVIGFAGSMKPWHGVEQLVEAFARVHPAHPDAALLLVGSGPAAEQVCEQVRRAGLGDSVICTGQLPHSAVLAVLSRFDVAVAPYLPAQDFYFHPLKVVEYLAAGKPVIYADQGDLPALVGSAGLGFHPGSVSQLADRLARVLTDSTLRERLATSAAARGADFDWNVIADRVVQFAAAAAAQGRAPGGMLEAARC